MNSYASISTTLMDVVALQIAVCMRWKERQVILHYDYGYKLIVDIVFVNRFQNASFKFLKFTTSVSYVTLRNNKLEGLLLYVRYHFWNLNIFYGNKQNGRLLHIASPCRQAILLMVLYKNGSFLRTKNNILVNEFMTTLCRLFFDPFFIRIRIGLCVPTGNKGQLAV